MKQFEDFVHSNDGEKARRAYFDACEAWSDVNFTKDEHAFLFQLIYDVSLSLLSEYHEWNTAE